LVSWGEEGRPFRVWLEIVAVNRVGLLSHLSAIVSNASINITAAQTSEFEPGLAKLFLQVEVVHRNQLTYLRERLEQVVDVVTARELPNYKAPEATPPRSR